MRASVGTHAHVALIGGLVLAIVMMAAALRPGLARFFSDTPAFIGTMLPHVQTDDRSMRGVRAPTPPRITYNFKDQSRVGNE